MIELYLSSDGKHTVHASADTPEQLGPLLPHVRAIYEQVVEQFGTQAQMRQQANCAPGKGQTKAEGHDSAVTKARDANAPTCPLHGKSMIFRRGRFGGFWSCPARTPDGNWCRYTVDVPEPGDGHTARA